MHRSMLIEKGQKICPFFFFISKTNKVVYLQNVTHFLDKTSFDV